MASSATKPKLTAAVVDTDIDDDPGDERNELNSRFIVGSGGEEEKMNSGTAGGGGEQPPSGGNGLSNGRNRFNFDYYEAFWKNRHKKIQASLLLIIFLLGLTLLIIGIQVLMYTLQKPDPVCQTSRCLYAAARYAGQVNWSAADVRCENFYDYACGQWIDDHRLTEYQGWYSATDQIRDDIRRDLKHYLDRILTTGAPDDPFHKAKMFYEKCMNLEEIDLSSLNYIIHEIVNAGGWNIIGNWHGPSWNAAKALQMLHTYYGVEAFFRVSVGADDLDPQLPFIIKIFPAGLGLPDRSYYFEAEYKPVVEAYKQYMSETVKIFGSTTKLDASQFAENTFNYEKRMAEITPSKAQHLQHPEQMFKRRYSIRELKVLAPSIKWLELLQNYFVKARLNDNTRVLLAFEPYFRNISNIISTTDSKGLNDYLIWTMLRRYAPYLSKDFRIIHYNFQQALNDLPSANYLNDDDRWQFCLDTTGKYLGHAMSALYVSHRMDRITNDTIYFRQEIFNHISRLILDRPRAFDWFSGESDDHRFLNMKIKSMEVLVGFPQFYRKPRLAGYYNEYFVGIKFLQNIFEAINHRHKKWEMLLNEKNLDLAWPVFPHQVEFHYDYAGNKLFVPAATLQVPYLDRQAPLAGQFGALGWHATAHMLKAFDLTGLHYNLPDGRLSAANRQWVDHPHLNWQLHCLGRQIRAFSDKLNNTVSQTYIDLGALHFAWWAYRDRADARQEPRLPAIPFTNDQLFFLSFAQTFCKNIKPKTERMLYESSTELPDRIRVNLLLSQSEPFQQTFQCRQSATPNLHHSQCSPWSRL